MHRGISTRSTCSRSCSSSCWGCCSSVTWTVRAAHDELSLKGRPDRLAAIRPFLFRSGRSGGLERRHVDDEAILDVALLHPVEGLLDVLHADRLDIRGDALLGAEIQHLLSLR